MKTPGVYIVEKNAFPNSVVEVATAVPAFIGYTEKADNHGKSLVNIPWRISSMAEFHDYYGMGPKPLFTLSEKDPKDDSFDIRIPVVARLKDKDNPDKDKEIKLEHVKSTRFFLYYSMLMFFQNGGGPCYIV